MSRAHQQGAGGGMHSRGWCGNGAVAAHGQSGGSGYRQRGCSLHCAVVLNAERGNVQAAVAVQVTVAVDDQVRSGLRGGDIEVGYGTSAAAGELMGSTNDHLATGAGSGQRYVE